MSIDWNAPLELDDGSPCTLQPEFLSSTGKYVKTTSSPNRNGSAPAGMYYYRNTGIFGGGDEMRQKVLRNVALGPDLTKDWFS